ncbi:MAG: glycerophosphodiester phosphodiesterase family protein [Leptospirales bacterium]
MRRVLRFVFEGLTALALSLTTLQLTACIAGYQRQQAGSAASVPRPIPGRLAVAPEVESRNATSGSSAEYRRRILNFAHRGASAYIAEHTLGAYRTAISQGADYLEVDVHGSRDGALVLVHDASLKRTTGANQMIRDLTLREIHAIDPNILTVQQLFAAFPATPINIEIKQREPSIAAELAGAIRAAERENLVIVSSGSSESIAEFRSASGGRVATGAALTEVLGVYGNYLFGLGLEAPLAFDALQVPYQSIAGIDLSTPEFIAYARKHELEVHFWTVDEASEMERLILAGANGIMTNRPDILTGVLRSLSDAPASTN